jgi:gas vesicle protein
VIGFVRGLRVAITWMLHRGIRRTKRRSSVICSCLDRFDKNEGGASFVLGLLTGTVVGVGLGMLFAPKAGSELRKQLSDHADALANEAQEGFRRSTLNAGQWAEKGKEAAGEWAERGKDLYGRAREAVSRGADEAQQAARDAADAVKGVTPAPATVSGTGSSESTSPSSYGSSPNSYPRSTESTSGGGLSSSNSGSPLGPSGRTGAGSGRRRS